MLEKELGRLASGHIVYDRDYDPILSCKPKELLVLLPEIFTRIRAHDEYRIAKELPFFSQMGVAYCVDTSKTDQRDIYYAKVEGKAGYSRFVMNRDPEPTKNLVVILLRVRDGNYALVAYYPGNLAQPEPWQYQAIKMSMCDDPMAANKSWSFWKKHAFVEGYKTIVPSTKTTVCPWKMYGQKSVDLK